MRHEVIIVALVGVVSPAFTFKLCELVVFAIPESIPFLDELLVLLLLIGNAERGVAKPGVFSEPLDDPVEVPVVKAEVGVDVAELPELNLPTNHEGVQPRSPVLSFITYDQ